MESIKGRIQRLEDIIQLFNVDYLAKLTEIVKDVEEKKRKIDGLYFILLKVLKNQDPSHIMRYLESGLSKENALCVECGKDRDLHWHHVIPRSRGGTFTVPLCERCHSSVHFDNPEHFVQLSTLIRNGISESKKRAVSEGRTWNGGRKPLSAETILNVIELHKEKKSIREIARMLGIGKTSVERILKNQKNQGINQMLLPST